jgi:hypothetical protein
VTGDMPADFGMEITRMPFLWTAALSAASSTKPVFPLQEVELGCLVREGRSESSEHWSKDHMLAPKPPAKGP